MERSNRTLATQMAILMEQHQQNWNQHFLLVLWTYQTAVQESSRCKPTVLTLGQKLHSPLDLVSVAPPEPEIAGGVEADYFQTQGVTLEDMTTLIKFRLMQG